MQNIYVPREVSGSEGADKAALRLANRLNGVPGDQKKSITQMIMDRCTPFPASSPTTSQTAVVLLYWHC